MRVSFLDLALQYQNLKVAMDPALRAVLEKGAFIGGEEVEKFEREFSRRIGIAHCVGVGNGTDALFLSLKTLDIGPGDRVLTTANSFVASAEAITMAGATPVFADCDPKTYLIDLDHVERILSRAQNSAEPIKAVMPVHLYGRAVNMDRLLEMTARYRAFVIEDCAQAHFAKHNNRHVGTFGDIGCFSFYPGKNLGAYGDAGAVVTGNSNFAAKIRMLHDHGRNSKYDHEFPGVNSRLDALQAAVLNVKLPYVQEWNQQRCQHARRYVDLLKSVPGIDLPECPQDGSHVFHLFVIRTKKRASLQKALQEKGISTGIHYPLALPNTKAYKKLGHRAEDFPVASAFQDQIMSLPMFPELTEEQICYVGKAIQTHMNAGRS